MEKIKRKLTQTKRFQWTMLFCIRLAQTALLSLIPSVICVLLLFMNPNIRVWSVASGLALTAFIAGNCVCWLRFMVKRMNVLEYYVINIAVAFLYFSSSYCMAKFSDAMEYSWFFANMRFFETLNAFIPTLFIRTKYSIFISNGLFFIAMIVTERLSHIKIRKLLLEMEANKPLEAEIKESVVVDESAPTQNSEEIKVLSYDELKKEVEQDVLESLRVRESLIHGEKNSDVWDGGEIIRGKGEKVERIDYSSLSDEEILMDFIKNEDSGMEDYDSDSLWNKDIYSAHSEEAEPITDYSDEYEGSVEDDEPESLWNMEALKGRKRLKKSHLETEDKDFNIGSDNDNYESTALWSEDFYKSSKNRADADSEEENDWEEPRNFNDDYSEESLWDIDASRLGNDDTADDTLNSFNDDYDSDSLWNIDASRLGNDDDE